MGQLIHIHQTSQARQQGAFAAVDIAARRFGIAPDVATQFAVIARDMVKNGCTAGRAVAAVKALAKRSAPVRSA